MTMHSRFMAGVLIALTGSQALGGGPSVAEDSGTFVPTKSVDMSEMSLDIPVELAEAGWTLESLAAMSPYATANPASFDPAAQPATEPVWYMPQGLESYFNPLAPGTEPRMEQELRPVRGFIQLPPWPKAQILYGYSTDIINLFLNPPDDPDPVQINAMQAIPNLSFVFLYVQAVTQQRVKFIAYDASVHTGKGYILVESTGPEPDDPCIDVAALGYQANPEGQLFQCCGWNDFGNVLGLVSFAMGMDREHQRPDRDQYIKVNFQNIGPAAIFGGIGVGEFTIQEFGSHAVLDYDYGSIQHFSQSQSSINGLPTIEVKSAPGLAWLAANPIVEQNLVILYPDIITASPGSPAYDVQLIEALQRAIGTGGAFSDGDLATIYVLYGNPGEPYPWTFDPLQGCPADVNQDGRVTVQDLVDFMDLLAQQSPFSDLNGDGRYDFADFQILYAVWQPGYCITPGKPKPPTGRPVVGINN